MSQATVRVSSDRDLAISYMRLSPLLNSGRSRAEVRVGIVDGGVDSRHPDLTHATVDDVGPRVQVRQDIRSSHATFVAGVICADAGSRVPGICPNAHILNCPIAVRRDGTHEELDADSMLTAIEACISSGSMILNLSLELVRPSASVERRFNDLMNYAVARGVLVIRATGNDASASGGVGPQHSWPIRVVGYLRDGRATNGTQLGKTLGCRGVGAPSWATLGLGMFGGYQILQGTSVATAYVTAALALLWSTYPGSSGVQIRRAVTLSGRAGRVIPGMLDMTTVCKEMVRL